jgi:hypothetical protein
LKKIITSLKPKNSHGYGGISVKILKLKIPFIIPPLTYICNKSLSSGIFPPRLKFSEIKSLFEKGEWTNIFNYRPVSFLTSFSKIFEKVKYSRLYHHINQDIILVNEQYGFRNSSSTEKVSFKRINDILLALNNKLTAGGIFCDLGKSFDCVNHNILLSKFEFYWIVCKANTLIKSYLNDRYQRTVIDTSHSNNSSSSDWVKVKNWVPQCSILCPLLFLFHVNDLPGIITNVSQPVLFADDTSILISKPSPTEFINNNNKLFGNIND